MNEKNLKRIFRMVEELIARAVMCYEWHRWQKEARRAMRDLRPCAAEMALRMAEQCRPDRRGESNNG